MTPEDYAQGIGLGFAIVLAMAGAFWWGYEVRDRLALKLEALGVTNRRWVEYDEKLLQQQGKLVPRRAELREIKDRQSER